MAAHGGLIATGSFNVLIGGRPAARVGDTIACPFHGTGVISKGSFTVLINGMPAARLGDITGCMVPGLAPVSIPQPTLGLPAAGAAPQGAAPIEGARSLAPQYDHQMHDALDKAKDGVSAMHIEGRISDGDGDGNLDTAEGSLEAVRLRNAGQVNVGEAELGGTHSMDMLYANGRASYIPGPGMEGGSVSGTAEAGMVKWGAGGTIGAADSKGLNPILGVAGEVNMMHAKADGDMLIGSDGNRVGLVGKGELGAEALKGEAVGTTTIPIWPGYNVQAVGKASAAAGAVGGGGGAWLYYDKKQGRLRGGIMGILKVLVGLGAEVEISVGRAFAEDAPAAPAPAPPPLPAPSAGFGGYLNTPGLGPAGLPGAIMLGNPRVLIGG